MVKHSGTPWMGYSRGVRASSVHHPPTHRRKEGLSCPPHGTRWVFFDPFPFTFLRRHRASAPERGLASPPTVQGPRRRVRSQPACAG